MDDLLKLSVEELEHILAVAPYSELHQIAHAIKKNELPKGAMHQVEETAFFNMYKLQEAISEEIIISSAAPQLVVAPETVQEKEQPSIEFKEKKQDKVKKSEKKKKEESVQHEEVIKPEKKKKEASVQQEEAIKPEKKKNKKKKDISTGKTIGKKKKKAKKKKGSRKNVKSLQIESSAGLSDFSIWLLEQSGQSEIHAIKKTPKKKKKVKKDKSVVSEPLADLLALQGHTLQAIDMYHKLSLIFPEKSAFFAAKIDKIQNSK